VTWVSNLHGRNKKLLQNIRKKFCGNRPLGKEKQNCLRFELVMAVKMSFIVVFQAVVT
jgi:hypothetical protein